MTGSVERVRLAACWGAIAACWPYLGLKFAWIAGSGLGTIGDGAALMGDPQHVVGNVVTAGMDLVAILVALAFTYQWGQRLPAWLVLVPIWIGTGLLAPIALGLPLGLLVQGVAGGSAVASDNGLAGWVYGVIYGGFTLQAVLLVTAFVLYARTRWPGVFRLRTKELPGRSLTPVQGSLITTAAGIAIAYAVLNVVWVVTDGAWAGNAVAVETAAQKTFWMAQGGLSLSGAIGLLTLARRWGRGRALLPVAATWLGTGVIFASGLYAALVTAGESPIRLVILLITATTGLLMAGAAFALGRFARQPVEYAFGKIA